MMKIGDPAFIEFKNSLMERGADYETDEEYIQAFKNLVGYFDVLIEMDQDERKRKHRLIAEPKGYTMAGEGRNCSLCGHGVYTEDGWYDKWGFKCKNCQNAVDKKTIPGSMCGDSNHEKCITDSDLAYTSKLHLKTIRELIRNGDIKARQIPNGPYLILRKENTNLVDILEEQKTN
jgi:hypothetical protein